MAKLGESACSGMGVSGLGRGWHGSERATVAIKGRYSVKEGVKKLMAF